MCHKQLEKQRFFVITIIVGPNYRQHERFIMIPGHAAHRCCVCLKVKRAKNAAKQQLLKNHTCCRVTNENPKPSHKVNSPELFPVTSVWPSGDHCAELYEFLQRGVLEYKKKHPAPCSCDITTVSHKKITTNNKQSGLTTSEYTGRRSLFMQE